MNSDTARKDARDSDTRAHCRLEDVGASRSPVLSWPSADGVRSARWHSGSGTQAPSRIVVADDRITADTAYRLACEGVGLLWAGDYHNARQLLQALARRTERSLRKAGTSVIASPAAAFHRHRQLQGQRARTLGMLLLPVEADYRIALRRAPDVRQAFLEAFGPDKGPFVVSLRELHGVIGAHEWRKKGVLVPALGERIHPHYGVYSPLRGEYVDLVAQAPLPALCAEWPAFDIGTGTGVLAVTLARRGVGRIIATDQDPRALACARDNFERLGVSDRLALMHADLFPPGRAALVVCNPPWIPARPTSPVEHALYDPDSRMLRGFLAGLAMHLIPGGEGWLILSDLAEHLGLRTRAELLGAIEAAGLHIVGRADIRPRHPKAADQADPLHAMRAAERTSLWRLALNGVVHG